MNRKFRQAPQTMTRVIRQTSELPTRPAIEGQFSASERSRYRRRWVNRSVLYRDILMGRRRGMNANQNRALTTHCNALPEFSKCLIIRRSRKLQGLSELARTIQSIDAHKTTCLYTKTNSHISLQIQFKEFFFTRRLLSHVVRNNQWVSRWPVILTHQPRRQVTGYPTPVQNYWINEDWYNSTNLHRRPNSIVTRQNQ